MLYNYIKVSNKESSWYEMLNNLRFMTSHLKLGKQFCASFSICLLLYPVIKVCFQSRITWFNFPSDKVKLISSVLLILWYFYLKSIWIIRLTCENTSIYIQILDASWTNTKKADRMNFIWSNTVSRYDHPALLSQQALIGLPGLCPVMVSSHCCQISRQA